ncbi:hypothetical protein ACJRO7_000108 [Eucalyptus globulus]|uniref:Uncharacterized protein n=1 Tax=Eucalyptus globulus TaxID=34317 RepID=A0ABD3LS64_EUCGL
MAAGVFAGRFYPNVGWACGDGCWNGAGSRKNRSSFAGVDGCFNVAGVQAEEFRGCGVNEGLLLGSFVDQAWDVDAERARAGGWKDRWRCWAQPLLDAWEKGVDKPPEEMQG